VSPGPPKLGYRRVVERDVNGRPFTVGFEADAEGTARVRRVFELAAEGRSTREIGEELGMQPTQVRRILASTEYRGDKGFPRIIEPELWARARRRLREARPRRRSQAPPQRPARPMTFGDGRTRAQRCVRVVIVFQSSGTDLATISRYSSSVMRRGW
jgi:hypothetical protein